jgi:hypothetical protein
VAPKLDDGSFDDGWLDDGTFRARFARQLRDATIDVVRGNLAAANRNLPSVSPGGTVQAYELAVAEMTTEELARRATGTPPRSGPDAEDRS